MDKILYRHKTTNLWSYSLFPPKKGLGRTLPLLTFGQFNPHSSGVTPTFGGIQFWLSATTTSAISSATEITRTTTAAAMTGTAAYSAREATATTGAKAATTGARAATTGARAATTAIASTSATTTSPSMASLGRTRFGNQH
ncbi:hypothetical protein BGX27_001248 [Mortierella sp. AM989]|nr:hypothetical protein BGX27_001248 [Mortierella sp. AM989]